MRLGPCWPLTTALPAATAAAAVCAALLTGAVPAGAAALTASRPASGGTWGTAQEGAAWHLGQFVVSKT
jgi:hypothetical protein